MLRTTIQTTDEGTGKELLVPADLRAKVQRAADILSAMLHKVGEKFDIEARWWFEPKPRNDFAVVLRLSSAEGGLLASEFPKAYLDSDDSIRSWLWTPTGNFTDILSDELDREFARIRHGLEVFVAEGKE